MKTDCLSLFEFLKHNLAHILNKNLTSVCIYGSYVYGDFDFENSDIDILTITQNEITEFDFNELKKFHTEIIEEFPSFDNRIEIAYISKKSIENYKNPKQYLAIISPGEPFNVKEIQFDWWINLYLIRNKNLVLSGENPSNIIPFIHENEFIYSVKQQLYEWENYIVHTKNSKNYQAYAVLTVCRILYSLNFGTQATKIQAAQWVSKKYPDWEHLITICCSFKKMGAQDNFELKYLDVENFVKYFAYQISLSQ